MLSHPHQNRLHQLSLLAGLACLACYYLALRPLIRWSQSLDQPLTAEWKRLTDASAHAAAVTGYELASITNQLKHLRQTATQVYGLQQEVWDRLELEPLIRDKLKEPFQLIDFQNERYRRTEDLRRLAQGRGVALETAAIAGFPEYTADTRDPQFLWAQLALADHLVATAIHCRVSAIQSVSFPPIRTYALTNSTTDDLLEIAVRIELTGAMSTMNLFLNSIPQRAAGLAALGLTNVPAAKPAMFIDRLMMKRTPADRPDEASLDVRASSFILRPAPTTVPRPS